MDNAPGSSAAPEQPLPRDPSATTRRRLVRRTEGRVIGGVAGGLGDHTGLDPAIFRIAFIALAVTGGVGIVAYLVGWLVLPEAADTDGFAERAIRRLKSSRFVPFVLIGIAVVVLLDSLSSMSSPLIWALALIAMGVVLLRDDPDVFSRPASATADAAPGAPSDAGVTREAAVIERVRRPRKPRSPLTLYTIGGTLVVLALMAALAGLGAFQPDLAAYFGLALAGVGAGVVASAWWGRSLLLKLLGIVLVPPLLVASLVEVPIAGSLGGRYMFAVRDDPSGEYETLAGQTTFDLARYEFGSEPVEIDASMVAGNVTTYVPPGVTVHLDASVDAGRLSVFGNEVEGMDLKREGTFRREGSSEGEVILKVRAGLASVNLISAFWIEDELAAERREQEAQAQLERDQRQQERIDRRAERRARREARRDRG